MKKNCISLILLFAIFIYGCGTRQVSIPDGGSPAQPTPLPNGQGSTGTPYPPTPVASNTPFVSPTMELFATPTYSSTLTPIPTLASDQNIPLVSIHGMNVTSGWGVDENGHILHTRDGGITWNDVTPPQGAYREDGFFAMDAQTAWATPYCLGYQYGGNNLYFCDNVINQTNVWRTQDGGRTWSASQPICIHSGCSDSISAEGDGSLLPESLRFIDSQHGWLAISRGSSMFQNRYNAFYTEDGGENWRFLFSAGTGEIISGSITTLEPLDEENVFLFTDQTHGAYDPRHDLEYSLSNDGGNTWKEVSSDFAVPPIQPSVNLNPPAPFTDHPLCGTWKSRALPPLVLDLTQECRYLSESNQIISYFIHMQSEDGGNTWNSWRQTGDVDFINGETGWEMVSKSDNLHEIRQTQDGGLTWSTIKTVEWDGVLHFVNDQIGYALAYNQGKMAVLFTADGGRTWELRSQASPGHIPCLISTWDICVW